VANPGTQYWIDEEQSGVEIARFSTRLEKYETEKDVHREYMRSTEPTCQ
jgi:hypothetical protein